MCVLAPEAARLRIWQGGCGGSMLLIMQGRQPGLGGAGPRPAQLVRPGGHLWSCVRSYALVRSLVTFVRALCYDLGL
jgi:hypothetical protein